MKVGDTIFLEPLSNAARYSKEIKEDIIEKIGNKYFYLKIHGKFNIDSMMQDNGQYSSNYKAYKSRNDLEDKKLYIYLKIKIKEHIEMDRASLENLIDISKIIGL